MMDVIKCDVNNARNECLHVAAMRHDIALIDLILKRGANPLQLSGDRYKETALGKCEWYWKLFCEQKQKKMDDDEKEQSILKLDDLNNAPHAIGGSDHDDDAKN